MQPHGAARKATGRTQRSNGRPENQRDAPHLSISQAIAKLPLMHRGTATSAKSTPDASKENTPTKGLTSTVNMGENRSMGRVLLPMYAASACHRNGNTCAADSRKHITNQVMANP